MNCAGRSRRSGAGRLALHPARGARRGRLGSVVPAGITPDVRQSAVCRADRPGARRALATAGKSVRRSWGLLAQADRPCDNREDIAGAIVALQAADAVIAGPLSPDDANSPGLLPHLAELADRAYRALRPSRELIVHPAFGQVARRFQYIQMTRQEARSLGAGAIDLGILAQRLRSLQGDSGEFAITEFGGQGLLWADHAWWEIEPIGNVDDSAAAAVFCVAWVVARRFRRADAAQALAYARAAAVAATHKERRSS